MELISIVVPVYRVEKYLDRCIQSLVKQRNVKIEIILVDDGSPDQCPQICDLWGKKDARIKVLHKKNGGLSDARNEGLKIAKGTYIAFVDGDDWAAENLYQVLSEALEKTESDIACCEFQKIWKEKEVRRDDGKTARYEVYDTKRALQEVIADRKIKQVVWNKLYRREIIEKIWFAVGKYHEDEFWTYQVIGNAKQIVCVSYLGYFYFQRKESIMNAAYSEKRLDAIEAKIQRQKYLGKEFPELAVQGKRDLLYTCFFQGQQVLKYCKMPQKKKTLQMLKKVFKSYRIGRTEKKYISAKDRMWFEMGKCCFEITCRIRNIRKAGG